MFRVLTVLVGVSLAFPAMADPWKDESGHGRGGGEWKQEYRDGNCKVERKLERSGEYKEEVKCDGPPWASGYLAPLAVISGRRPPPVTSLPPMPPGPLYGDIYQDDLGRHCREYQTNGTIDGRRQRLYGTACLQPDDSWAFNN